MLKAVGGAHTGHLRYSKFVLGPRAPEGLLPRSKVSLFDFKASDDLQAMVYIKVKVLNTSFGMHAICWKFSSKTSVFKRPLTISRFLDFLISRCYLQPLVFTYKIFLPLLARASVQFDHYLRKRRFGRINESLYFLWLRLLLCEKFSETEAINSYYRPHI